jgi:hypothetical protein
MVDAGLGGGSTRSRLHQTQERNTLGQLTKFNDEGDNLGDTPAVGQLNQLIPTSWQSPGPVNLASDDSG